jgi:hypothetical protein
LFLWRAFIDPLGGRGRAAHSRRKPAPPLMGLEVPNMEVLVLYAGIPLAVAVLGVTAIFLLALSAGEQGERDEKYDDPGADFS